MEKPQDTFSNKPFIVSALISAVGCLILIYLGRYLEEYPAVKVLFGILGASLILAGGINAGRYAKQIEDYNKSHGIYKDPIFFWRK